MWTADRILRFSSIASFLSLSVALSGQTVKSEKNREGSYKAGPKPSSVGIENPEALFPLLDRLVLAETGRENDPIHILHFGDSHSAADGLTGVLRTMLKTRFGDGGSGFSFAARPFAGYHRDDVKSGESLGWHTDGLLRRVGDGFLGIGGASFSTREAGRSLFIDTDCDHLEVYFLQQPGGGDVQIFDTDRPVEKFSTSGPLAPGFFKMETSLGHHHFVLKTLGPRPVRLFGWVADKNSGVTYETMAMNGAEATIMLRWDENMLAAYLQSRKPNLVVLAYGTNEALRVTRSSDYRMQFSTLLERIHRAVPESAILVLGPPDFCTLRAGTCQSVQGIDQIAEAQRAACQKLSCAFWDTREHMGGAGAIREWVKEGLAQRDYIHFTGKGYQRLSAMIGADLIREYEFFKKIRTEIVYSSVP